MSSKARTRRRWTEEEDETLHREAERQRMSFTGNREVTAPNRRLTRPLKSKQRRSEKLEQYSCKAT